MRTLYTWNDDDVWRSAQKTFVIYDFKVINITSTNFLNAVITDIMSTRLLWSRKLAASTRDVHIAQTRPFINEALSVQIRITTSTEWCKNNKCQWRLDRCDVDGLNRWRRRRTRPMTTSMDSTDDDVDRWRLECANAEYTLSLLETTLYMSTRFNDHAYRRERLHFVTREIKFMTGLYTT